MLSHKNIKTRGKIKFSQYFQEFKKGEKVAIVREHSLSPSFPKRIQGFTGVVSGMRGKSCIVEIMDGNKKKIFIVQPANLKKLKSSIDQKK